SGLAGTFVSMLVARVAVGVGEASYATTSPTIIDDLATKEEKNRWLAIFYAAIPVGAALGFVLGGIIQERYGWGLAVFIGRGPGDPPRALDASNRRASSRNDCGARVERGVGKARALQDAFEKPALHERRVGLRRADVRARWLHCVGQSVPLPQALPRSHHRK